MPSQNVAVRRDVYDSLRRQKRPDESFTGLFLRLMGQRAPLELAVGAWGKFDLRKAHRTLRELRGTGSEARR
jgi:predicted CopG family antitoxin